MLCLGGNRAPADTLEKGFAPQPIAAGMEPEELGRRWLKRAVPGQDMLFKKVQSRCELCLSEGLAFQHGLSFIVARMETNTADLFSAEQSNKIYRFISDLMYIICLAGTVEQAEQPNYLAGGKFHCNKAPLLLQLSYPRRQDPPGVLCLDLLQATDKNNTLKVLSPIVSYSTTVDEENNKGTELFCNLASQAAQLGHPTKMSCDPQSAVQ
eukprot:1140850-Pelagomonas_calceolata.AAC.9